MIDDEYTTDTHLGGLPIAEPWCPPGRHPACQTEIALCTFPKCVGSVA